MLYDSASHGNEEIHIIPPSLLPIVADSCKPRATEAEEVWLKSSIEVARKCNINNMSRGGSSVHHDIVHSEKGVEEQAASIRECEEAVTMTSWSSFTNALQACRQALITHNQFLRADKSIIVHPSSKIK